MPGDEAVVIGLRRAIGALVERQRQHGQAVDYYTSPLIGQMLSAFIGLLSSLDLGRLDAGTFDEWARDSAAHVGYDIETESMR